VTCGAGVPLAAVVTAGQAHESQSFEAVMNAVRPKHRKPMWVLGDKGYDSAKIRSWCERRNIFDGIPERRRRGKREGKRVFIKSIYKGRNVVERCIGWLKHNRRLGTRYEKLAVHYLSMVKLAFISRYLRLLEPSDTA